MYLRRMFSEDTRKTFHIALPIIIGNLTQMSLGLIDNAMVGAIHSTHLAAASLVNNVLSIPLVASVGVTMAISPLVAASHGNDNEDQPLRILYNAFWICIIISIMMALVVHFGRDVLHSLGQDPEVAILSEPYLIWMGWSIIPMTIFLAVKQFCDGLEKTRWPLLFSLAALPINVIVNYIFIFGKLGAPRMELEGAGVGTMVSRIVICIGLVVFILKSKAFDKYRTNISSQLVLRKHRLIQVLKLGIPSSLQFGMEVAAFAISGIMVGWLGAEQQAAHQIALSIAAMTFMVSMGLSAAGSIRIGNAYGRAAWGETHRIGISITRIALIYGVICGITFILFRHSLPYIFNNEIAVVQYAAILLMYAALFQISDSLQGVSVGLLRGIQDVQIPTFIVALSYWGIGLPGGYWFAFYMGMESQGIWLGLAIGLTASAILNTWRFYKLTHKHNIAKARH